MNTIIPEQIHLQDIIVKKSNIDISDEYLQKYQLPPESIRIQSFNKIGYNLKEKKVKLDLGFLFEAIDSKDTDLGAKAEFMFEFFYMIENLKDFTKPDEKQALMVDGIVARTLMSITYSTARGIIYERIKGTIFNHLILPVVDPKKIIEGK